MNVELQGVSKRFGFTNVLKDVSVAFSAGEIVTVLGPNGAGKTTLLKCLSGMAIPESGRILFDGEGFQRDRVDQRKRLHFMPDVPTLFRFGSVVRNLSVMLRLYDRDEDGAESRVADLLDEFDLLPVVRRRMNELSRGEEYKVSLVGLIAADPELWILDEPFASGMDPHGINAFKRHVGEAVKRGRTVVYSTQILEIAERFSTRVCVVNQGKIAADAPLRELRERSRESDRPLSDLFERLREDEAKPDLAT